MGCDGKVRERRYDHGWVGWSIEWIDQVQFSMHCITFDTFFQVFTLLFLHSVSASKYNKIILIFFFDILCFYISIFARNLSNLVFSNENRKKAFEDCKQMQDSHNVLPEGQLKNYPLKQGINQWSFFDTQCAPMNC